MGHPRREEGAGHADPRCLTQLAHDGRRLLWEGREGLVAEYGATLHIDLEEQWRSGGWGKKLIEAYVKAARESWEEDGATPGARGGCGERSARGDRRG
ncbi:unnamed protein product [Parascedosporium putredinis]|uniref:Uncharacterized protein n=1 Tax=Parascedosporium putredinis TaxID=1442378 RepID=A0A9P1H014_9PEZI|nr:unnamed protein product [Parascedosporium putredinis]CAI7992250.1 unnamed protein product [Parascedosporium putredinis]